MADNGINIGENDIVQDNQAACKPCATHNPVRTRMWLGQGQGQSSVSHIGLALMHKLKENILASPPPL